MKIAGHDIGDAIDGLYEQIDTRLRAEVDRELMVDSAEMNAISNIAWDDGASTVTIVVHEGVPTHALAHVVAVALQHVRQRLERYPAVRPPESDDPSEGPMLRQALRELVLSAEAEMQIASLDLDQQWEQEQRHTGLKDLLREPTAGWEESGSDGNKFMALQYARFASQHPEQMWEGLKGSFVEKLPSAAEHGETVLELVRKTGWGTLGGCLESLVRARDELSMSDVALIEDRRSGDLG